jgi:hypothetical protein
LEVRPPLIPLKEDDRAVPTLRTVFHIEKTASADPNTANIQIFNLNPTHREFLKQNAGSAGMILPVTVEGGYVGTREQLFKGDILTADSFHEGVDWITTIEASDGGKSYASKRFSKSFGAGTNLATVLGEVLLESGLGKGNLFAMIGTSPRKLFVFKKGVVVSGRISDIFDKYISGAGFQWSIQDGQMQLIRPGRANLETVVLLNRYSGLIGSPERGEKGKITFSSLLIGSVRPARRVVIESETATGTFVVDRVTYSGDTWGNEWGNAAEASPEKI